MFRSQKSRAIRSEVNRNRHVGLANRQWGICKKANTFFRLYNVEIAVVMRLPDGRTMGYESRRGLGQELVLEDGHEFFGPREMKDLDRSVTSQATSSATARNQQSRASSPPSETASSENLDTRPMDIVSSNDLVETASTQTLLAASASSTSTHKTCTPEEAPESDQAAFQRQSTDSNLDVQTHSSYNYSDMSSPLESTGQALGNDRQSDSAPSSKEPKTMISFLCDSSSSHWKWQHFKLERALHGVCLPLPIILCLLPRVAAISNWYTGLPADIADKFVRIMAV